MRCLILLLLVQLLPAGACAGSIEPPDAIRAAALSAIEGEAEVTLDPALRMPRCAKPLQARRNGNGTVEVSCADHWRLFVPVRIRRHAKVLVLTRNIAAGEVISTDMLTLETRDSTRMVGAPLSDIETAIGQTARRALAAGSVLTAAHLRAPVLVRRGDQVTLVSRQHGLAVRMAGHALSAGAVGERISAENASSRRRVQGVVLDNGEVHVVY